MRLVYLITCFTFTVTLVIAQLPPRLQIPGALLAQPPPKPLRRIPAEQGPPQRLRRPQQHAPIRPVVEEPEEFRPFPAAAPSAFDEEVNQLGLAALQAAAAEANDAPPPPPPAPRPVQFRPERPVPVLRQDVREGNVVQRPIVRQEQRETIARPILRQEARDEVNLPIRQPQPIRHTSPRHQIQPIPIPQQQPIRQQQRIPSRPQYANDDEDAREGRTRKPVVQILRKYRTDNPDGSITWGYENEDGSFKEENLGVDCVTRGKYGYIDPDGVRREYKYETGNKCDEPEEEEEDLPLPARPQQQPGRKPPQLRPILHQ